MRLAVISDLHANLEALEAVTDHISGQSVDKVVCLGDLVGYGADPNPCLDKVRELADVVVAGNHDYASVDKTDSSRFNPLAREAIAWTSRMLLSDHRSYLEKLPLTVELAEVGATLVHSTPSKPGLWWYLFSPSEAVMEFESFQTQCCFVGHTHLPGAFVRHPEGQVTLEPLGKLRLQEGYRYMVNVGSVGQPRDGEPESAYLVLDSEASTLDLHRVGYDIPTTQKKILQAGLPPVLAERLAHGR